MDISNKLLILRQKYGTEKDLYIQVPQEWDWKEGDTIIWEIQEDNSIILKNSRITEKESVNPYDIKKEEINDYLNSQSEGKDIHLDHQKDFEEAYDDNTYYDWIYQE